MKAVASLLLLCLLVACGQSATPRFQLTDITGANFGKAFKRWYGVSPGAFRRGG